MGEEREQETRKAAWPVHIISLPLTLPLFLPPLNLNLNLKLSTRGHSPLPTPLRLNSSTAATDNMGVVKKGVASKKFGPYG